MSRLVAPGTDIRTPTTFERLDALPRSCLRARRFVPGTDVYASPPKNGEVVVSGGPRGPYFLPRTAIFRRAEWKALLSQVSLGKSPPSTSARSRDGNLSFSLAPRAGRQDTPPPLAPAA